MRRIFLKFFLFLIDISVSVTLTAAVSIVTGLFSIKMLEYIVIQAVHMCWQANPCYEQQWQTWQYLSFLFFYCIALPFVLLVIQLQVIYIPCLFVCFFISQGGFNNRISDWRGMLCSGMPSFPNHMAWPCSVKRFVSLCLISIQFHFKLNYKATIYAYIYNMLWSWEQFTAIRNIYIFRSLR